MDSLQTEVSRSKEEVVALEKKIKDLNKLLNTKDISTQKDTIKEAIRTEGKKLDVILNGMSSSDLRERQATLKITIAALEKEISDIKGTPGALERLEEARSELAINWSFLENIERIVRNKESAAHKTELAAMNLEQLIAEQKRLEEIKKKCEAQNASILSERKSLKLPEQRDRYDRLSAELEEISHTLKGYNAYMPTIKSLIGQKKYGELMGLYKVYAELQESQEHLGKQLEAGLSVISTLLDLSGLLDDETRDLLKPYYLFSIMAPFNIHSPVEKELASGNPNGAVLHICEILTQYFENPFVQKTFIECTTRKMLFDAHMTKKGLKIDPAISPSILPTQMLARYSLVFADLIKVVEKTKGRFSDYPKVMGELQTTMSKIVQFTKEANTRQLLSEESELADILIKNGLLLWKQLSEDEAQNAQKEAGNVVRNGKPDDIIIVMKKFGIGIKTGEDITLEKATAIQQDFYYSLLHKDIREKMREVMGPHLLSANTILFSRRSPKYFISQLNDFYIKYLDDVRSPEKRKEVAKNIEEIGVHLKGLGFNPEQIEKVKAHIASIAQARQLAETQTKLATTAPKAAPPAATTISAPQSPDESSSATLSGLLRRPVTAPAKIEASEQVVISDEQLDREQKNPWGCKQ